MRKRFGWIGLGVVMGGAGCGSDDGPIQPPPAADLDGGPHDSAASPSSRPGSSSDLASDAAASVSSSLTGAATHDAALNDASETIREPMTHSDGGGAPPRVCEPDEVACVDNTPRRCRSDGSGWTLGEQCKGNAPACIVALGECGRCEAGQRQCDEDTVQVCNDEGGWETDQACGGETPVCLSTLASCVACRPQSVTCDEQENLLTCSNDGDWGVQEECAGATPVCYSERGSCGCLDGERKCDDNTPLHCDEGQWKSDAECDGETPVCLDSSGSCGCVDDELGCSGDVPRKCVGGQWEEQAVCGGPTPRCNAGACVCEENATRCSEEGEPEQCQDAQWLPQGACTFSIQVCVEGACECPEDEEPETTAVTEAKLGCGQQWSHSEDATDQWVLFEGGIHLDKKTRLAWAVLSGTRDQATATSTCEALSVALEDGAAAEDWRLPTIDELRELIEGCPQNQPAGTCTLSESDNCLDRACNDNDLCGSCLANEGPGADGLYYRPTVQLPVSPFHSASLCAGCNEASSWVFNALNGDFVAMTVTTKTPTRCVHEWAVP